MNLLIDFGSIKTGGGVQLATNFLSYLSKLNDREYSIFVLLPSIGPLSKINISNICESVIYYPDNYFKRAVFERTDLANFIKNNDINIIYTFFGAGLASYKGVKSVVSVAYPIICYPDSKYWVYVSLKAGIKKKIINALRRSRIRRADKVITETKVMAGRMEKYAGIEKDKIFIIPPSPSNFIEDKEFSLPKEGFLTLLVLSGVDSHKNLWRLPEMALALESKGFTGFKFLVSVTRDEFENTLGEISLETTKLLNSYFNFTGTISATEISQVYEKSNFLVNLSDLESYSNNYMEAWKSGLPLVVHDTDFSRHICRESAVYVNAHQISSSIDNIIAVFKSTKKQSEMVTHGKEYLAELPDTHQKFKMVLDVIRGIDNDP